MSDHLRVVKIQPNVKLKSLLHSVDFLYYRLVNMRINNKDKSIAGAQAANALLET